MMGKNIPRGFSQDGVPNVKYISFPKNVVKLTLLPWILSANFGPKVMKYSLNLLLISLRLVINLSFSLK